MRVRILPSLLLLAACAADPPQAPPGSEAPQPSSPGSPEAPGPTDLPEPTDTPERDENIRLRPGVGNQGEDELLQRARQSIVQAANSLSGIDPGMLSDQDQRRHGVARDLLSQAQRALYDGDPARAAELAVKAAVMAEDLSGR